MDSQINSPQMVAAALASTVVFGKHDFSPFSPQDRLLAKYFDVIMNMNLMC
jgi:hypothetical protein